METRMALVRHGDAGYPWGTLVGSTDAELAEGALEKAGKVGKRLKAEGLSALYSSALKRAWKTAEAIGKETGLENERIRELNEISFGRLEGKFKGKIMETWPTFEEEFRKDPWGFRFPGGETFTEVRERTLPVVEELFRRHEGKAFCVVAHGDVNLILLSALTGMPVMEAMDRGLPNLATLFFKKNRDKIALEKSWGIQYE